MPDRYPIFDPVSSGWFEKSTPIDYEHRADSACLSCKAVTPHDFYKAILGANVGFRLPFGRKSTAGKVGARSHWSFCAICGAANPLDAPAEAAVTKSGIRPSGSLSEFAEMLIVRIVQSVGDARLDELDEIAPDRPPANKLEWLVLHMFCVTRGISAAFGAEPDGKRILDEFHARIVSVYCSTLEEAQQFEQRINERYQEYLSATEGGTSPIFAGLVSQNVWGSTDAYLATFAAVRTHEMTMAMHQAGVSAREFNLL